VTTGYLLVVKAAAVGRSQSGRLCGSSTVLSSFVSIGSQS